MDPSTTAAAPKLRRALGLWALVLYGLVLTQPTAPMPCYGIVSNTGKGHVVTAILLGMLAMLLTAVSYGRMARVYPSAGSAYTYVGRELHPIAGFLTGWALIFDYVMNPIICSIWCSKAAVQLALIPQLPVAGWAVLFVLLFTFLNVRGIEASARTNAYLAAGLGLVIVLFLAAAARHLWQAPATDTAHLLRPFYDAKTFAFGSVAGGASLAVLTYIGFDAVSTLSEEARHPRRDILRATVLTCLVVGVLAAVEVYAAQLVWPEWQFAEPETAIAQIAGRIGGELLRQTITFALLLATIGSGIGAHLAAGRLLYRMGQDGALPARFFGALDPRTRVPRNNVLLVGALALPGVFLLDYDLGAGLLNFGAFVGFMGTNLAALARYAIRPRSKRLRDVVPPLLGFLVCLFLWLNLGTAAKVVGGVWLGFGLIFGVWQTRGFVRSRGAPAPEPGSEDSR
jgi:putrescine importer